MGLTRDNVVKALNNALAIILGVVIALLAGENLPVKNGVKSKNKGHVLSSSDTIR